MTIGLDLTYRRCLVFLITRVDGLITDNVSQAMKIASEMPKRSDLDRMVDKIKTMF